MERSGKVCVVEFKTPEFGARDWSAGVVSFAEFGGVSICDDCEVCEVLAELLA